MCSITGLGLDWSHREESLMQIRGIPYLKDRWDLPFIVLSHVSSRFQINTAVMHVFDCHASIRVLEAPSPSISLIKHTRSSSLIPG